MHTYTYVRKLRLLAICNDNGNAMNKYFSVISERKYGKPGHLFFYYALVTGDL